MSLQRDREEYITQEKRMMVKKYKNLKSPLTLAS